MNQHVRVRELEGSVRDLRLVAEAHEDRLDRTDKRIDEHSGYLASLDRLLERAEARLNQEIEVFKSVVNSRFKELREELRKAGSNGHDR